MLYQFERVIVFAVSRKNNYSFFVYKERYQGRSPPKRILNF